MDNGIYFMLTLCYNCYCISSEPWNLLLILPFSMVRLRTKLDICASPCQILHQITLPNSIHLGIHRCNERNLRHWVISAPVMVISCWPAFSCKRRFRTGNARFVLRHLIASPVKHLHGACFVHICGMWQFCLWNMHVNDDCFTKFTEYELNGRSHSLCFTENGNQPNLVVTH